MYYTAEEDELIRDMIKSDNLPDKDPWCLK